MMIKYLIKQNFLTAIIFSIIFHLVFIYNFSYTKKEETIKRYTVVNLASYKKLSKVITQEKVEKKPPIKEIKKLPVKEEEIVAEKKASRKIVKKEIKPEKVDKKVQKEIPIEKVIKKEFSESNNRKAITKTTDDNKILTDKLLTIYLNKVSDEINLLANNIYPRQSIMRREQGKIITRVIIDSTGKILKVIDITKKPKRLAKATKSLLLRKKKLIQPPEILFQRNNSITIEIPVNYVLD